MNRLAPPIFAVALVILAGCGSSARNSSSATDAATSGGGSLTKAAFIAKADALCEASKAKQGPQRKKLEEVTLKVQAFGVPKADAAQLEAIFRKTESAFEASLAYGAALEQREDAKAQAIAEKADAETRETAVLAKRYGFKVCGAQP